MKTHQSLLLRSCRSTARLSSGQRTALNDVEESHQEDRGGQAYYVYEHTSQVSSCHCTSRQEACAAGGLQY